MWLASDLLLGAEDVTLDGIDFFSFCTCDKSSAPQVLS